MVESQNVGCYLKCWMCSSADKIVPFDCFVVHRSLPSDYSAIFLWIMDCISHEQQRDW